MSFLTIILFFIYTYGFGFSIAKLVRESENFLERNLMRVGIGLATMIVLGLLLNLIKVPLDWRILSKKDEEICAIGRSIYPSGPSWH